MSLKKTLLLGGVAALILTACSNEPDFSDFENAVRDGGTCQELFDIRNSWDPKSPDKPRANEILRSIGCQHSSFDRTDQ